MEVQLNQSNLDKPLFILGHEWIMTSHIKPWVRLFIHKLIPVNPCLVRGEIPIKPCVVRGGISHYLKLISPLCRIYATVNWVSIGSDNGLSPVRRQAITWTNADLLSIGPFRTNFSEVWIKNTKLFIQENAFEKVVWKMAAILFWHQCVKPWLVGRDHGNKPLS